MKIISFFKKSDFFLGATFLGIVFGLVYQGVHTFSLVNSDSPENSERAFMRAK